MAPTDHPGTRWSWKAVGSTDWCLVALWPWTSYLTSLKLQNGIITQIVPDLQGCWGSNMIIYAKGLFISSIMLLRCEGLLFLYAQEGWRGCCPRWLKSICDFICPNNFILISTCSVYNTGMHNAQSIYSSLATVTMPPLSELTLVKTSKTHKTKQKQKKNGGDGGLHYS